MHKSFYIVAVTDEEVFKPITYPNIRENYYEISSYGNIRRRKDKKILSPYKDRDGYMKIELVGNTTKNPHKYFIHRLVAWEFVGHPPNETYVVNHKNSNRSYNYYMNLEWVTPKENTIHGITFGNITHKIDQSKRKYSVEFITSLTNDIKSGMTNSQIMNSYNLTGKRRKNINSLLNDIRYGKCYTDIHKI